MAKIWLLACVLATWGLVAADHGPAKPPVPQPPVSISPAPDSDCDNLSYRMMDCISYLSNGGKESKPDSSCCLGFEKIMKTDAKCICVALNSSEDLGVSVNMTRAMGLPSACGLSDHLPKCLHSEAPKPSPVNPPSKSTPAPPSPSKSTPAPPPKSSPPSKAEAPTLPPAVDDSTSTAPAPAPKAAGATAVSTNSVALLFSPIVASFFHMLA